MCDRVRNFSLPFLFPQELQARNAEIVFNFVVLGIRQIPELKARNWGVRSSGERLAVNTPIQGTAADVMKLAMIGAARALDDQSLRSRLILTIHDELLFEGPPEEADAVTALVEREMIAPWGDREPPLAVDVGVGETWLEAM